VRGHEVRGLAGLYRGLRQSHSQMSFADAGRSRQNHVGSLMHEPQCAQLANLPFIDRRLECEIEPIEGLQIREVRQLQSCLQVTLLSCIGFRAHHLEREIPV
jgi:hypothetical protein